MARMIVSGCAYLAQPGDTWADIAQEFWQGYNPAEQAEALASYNGAATYSAITPGQWIYLPGFLDCDSNLPDMTIAQFNDYYVSISPPETGADEPATGATRPRIVNGAAVNELLAPDLWTRLTHWQWSPEYLQGNSGKIMAGAAILLGGALVLKVMKGRR